MAITKKRISITIDIDLLNQLDAACAARKDDRSSMIERFCRDGLLPSFSKDGIHIIAKKREIDHIMDDVQESAGFNPKPDDVCEYIFRKYQGTWK